MKKYVTYKRVSTAEQAKSGLGLEAQERDIQLYLNGYSEEPWEVIAEFTDTGSGADNERPEFQKALALVRKVGAELLVAKLDRLSRRVSKIAELIEDRAVRFRVATMPHADPFQLHIYAALAEQEREFISRRTKAALDAARKRGVKLGGNRGGNSLELRNSARIKKADQYAERIGGMIQALRSQGKTFAEVVEEMAKLGIKRPQGGQWSEMAVRRALKRLPGNESEAA